MGPSQEMGSTVQHGVSCGGQRGQAGSADAQLHGSGNSRLTGRQDAVSIVSGVLLTRQKASFICGVEQTVVEDSACVAVPSAAGGVTACSRNCSDPRANTSGAEHRK